MKRSPAPYLLGLVSIVLAQGFYASHLNTLYYQKFGPFFDSMAYTDVMAEILTTAKEEGIRAGAAASFHTDSAVSLPWLSVSLLSPVLGYSRLVGVWMQEFWLAVLAISVFFYLHRYRGASAAASALLSIPFISFFGVYRHNGGVSDFRMDLFLYTFLSLMAVWYLATLETSSPLPWLLSGLFLLFTILNRATAPVYMAAMFGPPIAARFLLRKQERPMLLRRIALYWGAPLAVAAAALSLNWQFIHYYYFVWNPDANANLPLRESIRHVLLAGDGLGPGLAAAAALLFCLQLAANWRRRPLSGMGTVDWQLLYMGFAPALMLAGRGAGLNFLVSMPCVFGWLMFAIAPVRGPLRFNALSALGGGSMLAFCCFYAWQGYTFHTEPGDNRIAMMPALKRGLALMREDASAHGKHEIEFTTSHLVDFQASALRNVLVYELGSTVHKHTYRFPDGLLVRASYEVQFSPATPLDWDKNLPGKTDDEKLAFMAGTAGKNLDYYFLPDDRSIEWMEKNRAANFINTKMRGLKAKLLASGVWQSVGEPLVASEYETVILYARR